MNKHKQNGFSLIEVLVTIVVISFGFLSLLSLQMKTLNDLAENNQNTVAMSIANGMGERLRANRVAIGSYSGANTSTFNKDCSTANVCTMVNQDIWDFQQSIAIEPQLPSGLGTITVLGGVADIGVSWKKKDGTTSTFALQVPL